jgi:nicotinate-nucleotide adenylyltransferase
MIGVFGSAFNPPTLGHKSVIMQAAEHCSKILLVPSASHAFGKNMLPYEIRFRMLASFVQDIQSNKEDINALGNCQLEVCDIEQQMLIDGVSPIYTFDVLERLEQQSHTNSTQAPKFKFILGPDNSKQETWTRFYKHQEIDERWGKICCQEKLPVRSTQIRELVQKIPVDTAALLEMTTPSVASIIIAEQVYTQQAM